MPQLENSSVCFPPRKHIITAIRPGRGRLIEPKRNRMICHSSQGRMQRHGHKVCVIASGRPVEELGVGGGGDIVELFHWIGRANSEQTGSHFMLPPLTVSLEWNTTHGKFPHVCKDCFIRDGEMGMAECIYYCSMWEAAAEACTTFTSSSSFSSRTHC